MPPQVIYGPLMLQLMEQLAIRSAAGAAAARPYVAGPETLSSIGHNVGDFIGNLKSDILYGPALGTITDIPVVRDITGGLHNYFVDSWNRTMGFKPQARPILEVAYNYSARPVEVNDAIIVPTAKDYIKGVSRGVAGLAKALAGKNNVASDSDNSEGTTSTELSLQSATSGDPENKPEDKKPSGEDPNKKKRLSKVIKWSIGLPTALGGLIDVVLPAAKNYLREEGEPTNSVPNSWPSHGLKPFVRGSDYYPDLELEDGTIVQPNTDGYNEAYKLYKANNKNVKVRKAYLKESNDTTTAKKEESKVETSVLETANDSLPKVDNNLFDRMNFKNKK